MLRRFICTFACIAVWSGALDARAQFTISGTVTDAGISPAAGVIISLSDSLGTPIGIPPTVTDPGGFYAIVGLPSGGYVVGFETIPSTRLVPARLPVSVVSASATRDAVLETGILLSGSVTDTLGTPIDNIDLNVTDRKTKLKLFTPGDNSDSTGFYDVVIPAGDYDLRWRAVAMGALPYIPVEIRNQRLDTDTTYNVTMVIGVSVSGNVVDDLGAPAPNINLDFIDVVTGNKLDTPGDITDLAGNYSVKIPTGVYDVRVKPLVATHFLGQETTGVVVAGDTTVSFALGRGFVVSGVVSDPFASPVYNANVDVRDGAGVKLYTPFDFTDSLGAYSIVAPAGASSITFGPPLAAHLAPVVAGNLSIGADTTINVTVPAGFALSGLVQDSFLNPVPGVDIDVIDTTTGLSIPLVGDGTDADGAYSVVIAPGVYDVEFEPSPVQRLVAQKTFNAVLVQDTTLSVVLQDGIRMFGTVRDSLYSSVSGVDLDVFVSGTNFEFFTPGDHTDAAGFYEVIVNPMVPLRFVFFSDTALGPADTAAVEIPADVVDRQVDIRFGRHIVTAAPPPGSPDVVVLEANYPNPFNPSTTIRYFLPTSRRVSLVVYDARGARVRGLFAGRLPAGAHAEVWDGRDRRGIRVASGVYFYRLVAGRDIRTRKMLLVK